MQKKINPSKIVTIVGLYTEKISVQLLEKIVMLVVNLIISNQFVNPNPKIKA